MRVGLIICGELDAISGDPFYDRKLVEYLRGCGDTVEIFSLPARSYARRLADNVFSPLQQQIEAAQLDVLLQDEGVHPALLRLNRRLRGRVSYLIVSLVHDLRCDEAHSAGLKELYRWIERHYLASVDGFICTSEMTRRALRAVLDRTELARSAVAAPGGDRFTVTLTPEEIQSRASQPGPLRLVFVGDLIRRKGLLILLEALLKLPAGTCQLTVAGNAEIDALYMRVVYHLFMVTHLTGVTLAGVISDAELATLLAHGDVLVVPAEYEGFNAAYLEGMNFGLPAIGTTSGAAREIITDGVNGYLVSPNDPTALAERLADLASDRDKLAQLSLAARKRFLAQPGWNDSLARVRQTLLEWIEHPARKA